jgi:hypothetical protein
VKKKLPSYSSIYPVLKPFIFSMDDYYNGVPHTHNGSTKSYNPWDKIQLSKAERKDKTYEEIQAMKKAIYDKRIEK